MHIDALLHALRTLSASLAPIVVAGLWQGLALASALALALRIAPRLTATHRFAVWAAGFAALVCLPFLPLFSRAAASTPVAALPATAGPAPAAWFQLSLTWSFGLAALWAAASLWRVVDLVAHSLHLRRLWRTATPIDSADPRLAGMPTVESHRAPRICTTEQLDRPSVIGFFAPRILIPHWLLGRLTSGELSQIVLHESEHLRRRDDWTNLLQKLCLVLFPLNPALWLIERRLCREREMACDEGVVRITRAPRAYAACLTSLAERGLRRRAEALSLGAWHRRSELASRVHSLLLGRRVLNPVATRALLGVLGCGLLAGSVELARAPQLVAFVATQPAVPQRAKAVLPVRSVMHATNIADFRPLSTPRVSHALHAAARRNPASAQIPVTKPSASLLAALTPGSDPVHNPSANQVSTHSASAPWLQASNAPAPHSGVSGNESAPVQEWIVFTTWQQLQDESLHATSAPSRNLASVDHTDKVLDAGPAHRFTTRFTVMRVIFRTVPAPSAPAHPAIVPMREGWLVFQL